MTTPKECNNCEAAAKIYQDFYRTSTPEYREQKVGEKMEEVVTRVGCMPCVRRALFKLPVKP